MKVDAARALQLETEFLAGVENNFEASKGKQLRGTLWHTSRHDESDTVRALMAGQRIYDRELLKGLPANRRVCVHGYERTWWLGRHKTGVAVASVLAPLGRFVQNQAESGPPVGLAELAEHVRKLVTDPKVPHVIGVCSPTGFSSEARNARLEFPNTVLVLVEPKEHGGWSVHALDPTLPPRVVSLFDPEGTAQKLGRVRQEIEERSADLLIGGLSVSAIAERLELPVSQVTLVVEQAARVDAELRISRQGSDMLIFRGAPVHRQERVSMNMLDRIRQLFSSQHDEVAKINLLSERRAALAQRRDRLYEDIGKLENKETELLEQGRNSKSHITKRRLAAQLNQLRKDISRANTTTAMLNQQINIISTDIHNLTLIQQGQMASLPDTEELTQNAVRAEEMLETLKADADLVSGLETGISEMTTGEEELAILAEFEAPVTEAPSKAARAGERPEADPFREEPSKRKMKSADPEAT